MKIGYGKTILATGIMVVFILMLGLTSFQIGMYGDRQYQFYQKEYKKYQVAKKIGMEEEDLKKVTRHMMDFLIGKEEVLSIRVRIQGIQKDFFHHQDRLHMEDVKILFRKGLFLRNVLAVFFGIGMLYVLGGREGCYILARGYQRGLLLVGSALLLVGLGCWLNFSKMFVWFHEIFFTNDLWMFDAETDYMIQMLPEGFFLDMVKRIFGIYVGLLALFFGLSVLITGKIRKAYKKKKIY